MSALSDRRGAERNREAGVRSSARGDVRKLEAEQERLSDELGLRASRLYSGEGTEEEVREIEAELDEVERDLRRARAARTYVS
jgi:predicted  nucleic acid-binding Zn-ribbon protein